LNELPKITGLFLEIKLVSRTGIDFQETREVFFLKVRVILKTHKGSIEPHMSKTPRHVGFFFTLTTMDFF
jgi:hypothetical protein